MEISVRGRNVEVSDQLRTSTEHKINRLGRFLDGMERADVNFSEERNRRIAEKEVCEVTMYGHGRIVRARASATDQFAAVDRVVDRLEHRIEKLRGRLHGRSHPRRHGPVDSRPPNGQLDDEPSDGQPRIVKTKRFAIKPMTPEEAVLQMELLGHTFYFFADADSGNPAVVYRRDDGDVGLIEAS